jgi:hypothetical protein
MTENHVPSWENDRAFFLGAATFIVAPIEVALALVKGVNLELEGWIRARIERGDPGPVHFEGGQVWTDASEREKEA